MDKLARLESIIKHLASEDGEDQDQDVLPTNPRTGVNPKPLQSSTPANPAQQKTTEADGSVAAAAAAETETTTPSGEESPTPSSLDGLFGRLVIGESKSYYVSNVLWANLANEVDEIRDMLLQPEEDDEDEDMMSPKTSHSGISSSNAALFGFCALAHSVQAYHPTFSQAVNLFAVYTENVTPQVRLFHVPTLSRIYWDAIASLESLDKNTEALLFAIYYSAVASIDDRQTLGILGMTKDAALERYRFAVEQAMARADLLNTQSLILLQTAVLFLSALRSLDESRTTWSLTALVFHIAQTMGVHRDGTMFGLKPFETEMRRRLWWHICILDTRSSVLHGFQPIAHQFSSDTKFPLHVNDADLSPGMKDFPPVRHEATDMTLLLLRCEALNTAWKIGLASPGLPRSPAPVPWRAVAAEGAASGILSLEERRAIVRDLEGRLKDTYFRDCDPSNPLLSIYSMVADLIIIQFWLLVYHLSPGSTLQHSEAGSGPASNDVDGHSTAPSESRSDASADEEMTRDRDDLFHKSIDVLELSARLLSSPSVAKWTWYAKPHIQWHAVSFVLSEICSRPPSAECDRAWKAAMAIYEIKGTMWSPIRRLMAKAGYVREMQARSKGGGPDGQAGPASGISTGTPSSGFTSTGEPSPAPGWGSYRYTTADTSALEVNPVSGPGIQQGVRGAEADDPLMDLLNFPDDPYTDDISTFGLSACSQGFSLGMMGAGSAMDGWDGCRW
ncbi:hypothetical protein VMCG_06029 [Cytospora schulzeri]|uniref:Xylanolytic transcriptional activator regulatory domain-containing protein n=1 Tax=Cytospora schulzeri TaxID=448051 RepID=A0A423WGL0_9PEZI|nr:hypothetical protein VMCG_06029 [Valsa malicola]